jgi:hypothetical protein
MGVVILLQAAYATLFSRGALSHADNGVRRICCSQVALNSETEGSNVGPLAIARIARHSR